MRLTCGTLYMYLGISCSKYLSSDWFFGEGGREGLVG